MSREARVARTRQWDSLIRRAISAIRSGDLPKQRITSGNPRRRSRWESSFANPRSSYGRTRRPSMASRTVSFPAFKSRRRASTRSRSTASPDLFPLLELEHGAEGAAPLDLLADPILPLQDIDRAIRHLDGLILRNDDDPGFVADHPLARQHFLPAALDPAPDPAQALPLSGVLGNLPARA